MPKKYCRKLSRLHARCLLQPATPQIIDSKTFTKTEDHEVLIEKKRYELEHRPVEKQVCC